MKYFKSLFFILFVVIILSCEKSSDNKLVGPASVFAAPTKLEIRILAPDTSLISWQYIGIDEEGFMVDRKQDSNEWEISYQSLPENTLSFLDTELDPGSTYQYRVYAFLGDTNSSSITGEINIDFPNPSHLEFNTISLTSCELTWVDNCVGEDAYLINRMKDNEVWEIGYQTLAENSTTFTDLGLNPGSNYKYKIYAQSNEFETSFLEGEINLTFPAPTDFTVTPNSFVSFLLSWNYTTIGYEEGIKIFRRTSSASWTEIADLSITNTSYEDVELTNGENYEYRIYVYNNSFDGYEADMTKQLAYSPEGYVYVEGAMFTMGDSDGGGDSDELPTHAVTLNNFIIGQYEVTQGEYQSIMGNNPASTYGTGPNHPTYNVNWSNAIQYCNSLSEQEGFTPCYDLTTSECDYSANGYRLPTEAEWEYAARGGIYWSENFKYSGTTNHLVDHAVYQNNSFSQTSEVGSKLPNQLGIYDMSGNVWEWCNDHYDSDYYTNSPDHNPTGPIYDDAHIKRGGSFYTNRSSCRLSNRESGIPYQGYLFTGFRVMRAFQ